MSKFADKVMSVFQLSKEEEDYDYEDNYDDYEEDEEESYRSARSVLKKQAKPKYTEYEDEEEEQQPEKRNKTAVRASRKNNSKVVPMKTGRSGMEVCVIKPTSVEEAREVTDTLLSGKAVILNLEGLHVEIAQRIVDFSSGSCYAVNGNFQKVSNYIFVLTPENVDVSGDFQELLTSGGFDVSSFNK